MKRIDGRTERTELALAQAASVPAIAAGAARTNPRVDWDSDLRKYYDLPEGELQCTILSQLYPKTMSKDARWARERGWGSPFPAVGEHIVPQSAVLPSSLQNIEVWDAKNGIPLFRDIEGQFSAGKLSIHPCGSLTTAGKHNFQVFVCSCIRTRELRYLEHKKEPNIPEDNRVHDRDTRHTWIRFGDLHRQTFSMAKTPSMRALYMKAMMVFDQRGKGKGCAKCTDRQIPDPRQPLEKLKFSNLCPKFGDLLGVALTHVSAIDEDLRVEGSASEPSEPAHLPKKRRKR
eukprot:4503829-Amphidinium_carterae.1